MPVRASHHILKIVVSAALVVAIFEPSKAVRLIAVFASVFRLRL